MTTPASAVLHSIWNLWTKQIRDGTRSVPLIWMLTSISAACYAPDAIVAALHAGFRPTPQAIAWMGASAVIHVGYFLLLLRGYRVSDLSVVYPVARGTGPLLAALGAVALLGARLTAAMAVAALLIFSGIALALVRRS